MNYIEITDQLERLTDCITREELPEMKEMLDLVRLKVMKKYIASLGTEEKRAVSAIYNAMDELQSALDYMMKTFDKPKSMLTYYNDDRCQNCQLYRKQGECERCDVYLAFNNKANMHIGEYVSEKEVDHVL